MTVEELIQELQYFDRNVEVRIAQQPSWPFEYDLNGAAFIDGKVWLIEGNQLGYLPGKVAEDLGWK